MSWSKPLLVEETLMAYMSWIVPGRYKNIRHIYIELMLQFKVAWNAFSKYIKKNVEQILRKIENLRKTKVTIWN